MARTKIALLSALLSFTVSAQKVAKCEQCELVINLLETLSSNATSWTELAAIADTVCKETYVNDPAAEASCLEVVLILQVFSPILDTEFVKLDVDANGVCALLEQCAVPCCASEFAPEQIRLAYNSSDMSTMRVSWVTLNFTATSTVQFSALGKQYSVTGTQSTYTFGNWKGWIHTAVMTGLVPSATYSYRVGDASDGWSASYNFTVVSGAGTLRFVQIGDMDDTNASTSTINAIAALAQKGEIDFVLHTGNFYADFEAKHWDAFFRKIINITAYVPYMTSAGNHELPANFEAFLHRNVMPTLPSTPSGPAPGVPTACAFRACMYFGIEIGPLHLTVLHSESVFDTPDVDPPQAEFLAADLAVASAGLWKVATTHRPLYCTFDFGAACTTEAATLRGQTETILIYSGVDLVLSSHVNGYERTYPVENGVITSTSYASPKSPTYATQGAAGNREEPQNAKGNAAWSAYHSTGLVTGFAYVEVNSSALSYTFLRSNDSFALDTFAITR